MNEQTIARYERASPALLMTEPTTADYEAQGTSQQRSDWVNLRTHLETRMAMMRSWRLPWIQHWSLVAQYLNPRRSMWLTQGGVDVPNPNAMVRGLPINQSILDPTATYASQICSAGLMSGLMSPSRPWFKLKAADKNTNLDRPAQLWFEAVEDQIYQVMAHSNFYDGAATMMQDLVDFGTAPMIIYEDEAEIIRCYNPVVGEYFLGVGPQFRPETLFRQFVMTVTQIVEMFGLDNCPSDAQTLWATKGAAIDQERIVAHAIEPNYPVQKPGMTKPVGKLPGNFDYREYYWMWGASSDYPLSERGFKDLPFIAPRWFVTGNDPYGRSPAMTALGDIMQLQRETMRKGELLEKLVRPPLNAPIELKNQPSSILPGHLNYTSNPAQGIKPVFEVSAQALPAITEDLKEIQMRIKQGFFNDLFLMLAQATKDMTAYEVAQRQQEKLQVLGPVIERFQNEGASPAIKRIYAILARKQLLPPMPKSLHGVPLQIEYVSMLAMAQRSVATAGIERLYAMRGHLQAVNPQISALFDDFEALREYGDALGVSQKILNPQDKVDAMLQQMQRAQQAQQQAAQANHIATQVTPALAQAAQNMSNTDVGGGINALQAMVGGGLTR